MTSTLPRRCKLSLFISFEKLIFSSLRYFNRVVFLCFSEEKDSTIEFIWFKNQFDRNPALANKTLWNTCSVLSGSLLPEIFQDDLLVLPYMSTNALTFTEGAFGYDFELMKIAEEENDNEVKWTANMSELNFINRKMKQLIYSKPTIYGMDVSLKTAETILG